MSDRAGSDLGPHEIVPSLGLGGVRKRGGLDGIVLESGRELTLVASVEAHQ